MFWTNWIGFGGVLGALGVALGAFGSHGLKGRITPEDLAIFETAVRYQMLHAFALLAVGFFAMRIDSGMVRASGFLFLIGTIVFSGSLYTLIFSGQRWWGAVAPIGGASLIAGWVVLAIAAFRAASIGAS